MKRILLIALAAILSSYCASAQTIERLKIGDRIPEGLFKAFPGGGGRSLSEFRGKPLIVDVWASWCAPCIATMPVIHGYKDKYGDELGLLLVNYLESPETIRKFVSRREKLASRISLPIAMADSAAIRSLDFFAVPGFLWIDKEGILRYRTFKVDFTAANVERFIKEGKIGQIEDYKSYTFDSAAMHKNLLWKTELVKDRVDDYTHLNFKDSLSQAICANCSITELYRFAFAKFHFGSTRERYWIDPVPFNRTIVKTLSEKDMGMHYLNNVKSRTLYSYRISGPPLSEWGRMSQVILQDLENWVGYTAGWEKTKVRYYSLTIPDTTIFSGVDEPIGYKVTDTEFHWHSKTIDEFLRTLNANIRDDKLFLSQYPIVNESSYKGKVGGIDIENVDTSDPKALSAALRKVGITLKLIEGELDMLVIRDRTNQ